MSEVKSTRSTEDELSVNVFKRFLQFDTISLTSAEGKYQAAIDYLLTVCEDIGLSTQVVSVAPGKPILIASWASEEKQYHALPSILLNCHYDVVPVAEECWTHPPFAATELENGDIVARGSQDMKCVGIQYLEAIRRLKKAGKTVQRTLHCIFVPDEEIGGKDGMDGFLKTETFRALNVGAAMDEGLASPGESFPLYYAERSVWWILVKCTGPAGHGSTFPKDPATQKLNRVMQKFLQFRDEQEQKLTTEPGLKLGDVTTVNLTAMKSGVSDVFPFQNINVIPTEAYCAFDMRISPHVDLKSFEETHIKEWTKEEGVSYSFANKDTDNLPTSLDVDSNPYWSQCKAVFEKLQLEVVPQVFPAATDGRFLRRLNIPVFGFSPMNHTPVLLHDHDERLNSKVFLRGIEIYMELLPALSRTAVV